MIRVLVKEGRLELVSGTWVGLDEACPSFIDIILAYKVGHDFVHREFGV